MNATASVAGRRRECRCNSFGCEQTQQKVTKRESLVGHTAKADLGCPQVHGGRRDPGSWAQGPCRRGTLARHRGRSAAPLQRSCSDRPWRKQAGMPVQEVSQRRCRPASGLMQRISGDTCSARATRRGSSQGNLGWSCATTTVDAAVAGAADGVWPGSVAVEPFSGRAAREPMARVASSSSLAMVRAALSAGPAGSCAGGGWRVLMVFLLRRFGVFDATEEDRSWNRAPRPGSDGSVPHLRRHLP